MRVCIAGPIASADVAHLLGGRAQVLPNGYGGAPLTAVLIEELLRLGHDVVGVTTDSSLQLNRQCNFVAHGERFELRICPSRPRAWRFNGRVPGRAVDLWLWERAALQQAMQDSGADIIHAHWTYEFALAALAARHPSVVTAHDLPGAILRYNLGPYRGLRYAMARSVLSKAQHLTTVSEYLQIGLRKYASYPIKVIPNPVAAEVLERGRVRSTPRSRRIAMVCNGWGRRKNAEPALAAFARFRRKYPTAELHCIGSGFEYGGFAHRWASARSYAEGVAFRGPLAHRNVIGLLSGMDLLVHPALEESFGVVIAEAMALGLPVVAGIRSGAVPWVVNGGTSVANLEISPGILVDVRYPDAIEKALEDSFHSDYVLRSEAGLEQARARFAPAKIARAYLECYRSVVQARSQQGSDAKTTNEAFIP